MADVKFITVTQITTDPADHFDATFSADGNTIAYWVFNQTLEEGQLFTVGTLAPNTEKPVATPTGTDAEVPVFTPDGSNLVFSAFTEALDGTIEEVNIASGTVTQLSMTPEGDEDYFPSVSPDGTQVAFSRFSEGAEDNYVIPIATGELTPGAATGLTTGNLVTAGKSESPLYLDNSGEDIVYLSYAVGDTYHVFEMERTGATTSLPMTQLTTGPDEQFFNNEF